MNIPGIWVIPGSDDVILKTGVIPLGDDISSFGNGPPQFHNGSFFPKTWKFAQKHIGKFSSHEEFWNRFETCLQIHTGNSRTVEGLI